MVLKPVKFYSLDNKAELRFAKVTPEYLFYTLIYSIQVALFMIQIVAKHAEVSTLYLGVVVTMT